MISRRVDGRERRFREKEALLINYTFVNYYSTYFSSTTLLLFYYFYYYYY